MDNKMIISRHVGVPRRSEGKNETSVSVLPSAVSSAILTYPCRKLFPGGRIEAGFSAIEEYHRSLLQHGHNGDLSMARLEEARGHFAKLIGAESDEIAVLSSASEAIAGVATALPYVPGKEGIVYADTDFPTVGHIWQAQEMFHDHICCIPSIEEK